jgi:hypothetical protein
LSNTLILIWFLRFNPDIVASWKKNHFAWKLSRRWKIANLNFPLSQPPLRRIQSYFLLLPFIHAC